MAAGVFNIAKGKINEYVARVDGNDPTNCALIVVLLKTAEADATLRDYDTLSALLAGSNVECDFTNYARKTLVDTDLTAPAPDDTNDWQIATIPTQTWTSAGGATNNTTAKLLICYDADTTAGTDANLVPLTFHDLVKTTDGTDLNVFIPSTGFFKAA